MVAARSPAAETHHRRPDVTPIVHEGKGKRQLISSLADGDHAFAGRSEDTVRTLRQGLALEACECFRGSKRRLAPPTRRIPVTP